MSARIEDRLSAALRARAELVQPEDLRHLSPPGRRPRQWKKPAIVALAAAACVAVVVVPLVSRHHGSSRDEPAKRVHVPYGPAKDLLPEGPYQAPEATLVHRLTGDMDGDGRPDQVRAHGREVTVTLAADPAHPLTYRDSTLHGLVGLMPTTGGAHAIVEATSGLTNGDEWHALTLQDGELKVVRISTDSKYGGHGDVPGYRTSWLTPDGALMSGELDPLAHGSRYLAVKASRLTLDPPQLTDLGRWCWDVSTQQVPQPCPDGEDYAFDPGPRDSLPALLPYFDNNDSIGTEGETWDGDGASLRVVEGETHTTDPMKQGYDLVGTIDGHHVSAHAGGFTSTVFKTFVDLGHGVRGIVVEGADIETGWNVLSYVDGTLRDTQVRSDVLPGAVFDTFVGPAHEVFTKIRLATVGHFEVYRWEVSDDTGRYLIPVKVGEVCFDDFESTYGSCR
jgi:hypothetical protein